MGSILLFQFQSATIIKQLKKGNAQSVRTMQVDNLVNDIINEIFIIDDQTRNYINSGDSAAFRNMRDTLSQLENDKKLITDLAFSNDSNKLMISRFTSLIDKKTVPAITLKINSAPEENAKIVSALTSDTNKEVTDSIYTLALAIQLKFENDLEKSILDNERLSDKVLSLGKIVGLISIVIIAILVTIIIIRLLKHHHLIKALRKAKLQTEEAARVKEQFLSNMSHEIRTPVNSVIGFTSLLQKTDLSSEQGQFVGLIKSASENLLNIVNDILDISKIEAGMLHFDKNPFSVRELCYSVEMMFFHSAAEKNLLYEWIIDEEVPEFLVGDKERLTQILNNFINNALKFTDRGGITIHVSLMEINEQKVRLLFSVKDTGIGIHPDKLDTIFERFEQAQTDNTRNYGGTGLGLAIVKKLVEMQGGNISVKSTLGAGTEFLIQLPFEIGKEDVLTSIKFGTTKNICPVNESKNLAGHRILAAEDNTMNQMLLTYIFQQWQLDFDFAENGQKAIDLLQQNKYDLVLMDIQMPVMDGYTATGIIRNELKMNIPVIAMTAKVLPGEKERCQSLGMNNYISKPLNENILYDILLDYLAPDTHANSHHTARYFTDKNYLEKIYKGNTEFIRSLIRQFLEQYPAELDKLHRSVTARDFNTAVGCSHNMKTTVSSLNKTSPLLEHLENIENAENNAMGWEMIQYRMKMLLDCRASVLKEANFYINQLSEV
jgi:signal transduction histidine kinase/response regulator of citrate/malate metabolism